MKAVVKKYKLGEEPDSVFYWKRKSMKVRLEGLEFLRQRGVLRPLVRRRFRNRAPT